MPTPEIQDGVSQGTLIAAFIGSIIGLSYAPKMSLRQAVVALLTGWSVAIYGAPLMILIIEYYYKVTIPELVGNSISFFMGLIALRLVPVILFHVGQLKTIRFFGGDDQ